MDGASYKRGGNNLLGRELTPGDIILIIFSLVIAILLIDDIEHITRG